MWNIYGAVLYGDECFLCQLSWTSSIPILKHIILYSCTIINLEPFTEIGFALKFKLKSFGVASDIILEFK